MASLHLCMLKLLDVEFNKRDYTKAIIWMIMGAITVVGWTLLLTWLFE